MAIRKYPCTSTAVRGICGPLFFILCALAHPNAFGQDLLTDMWAPNGKVNTLAVDTAANVNYFGGSFTYVGPNRPFGAELGLADGEINMAFPAPNKEVLSVAPDGHGGWFIGGKFTSVGGQMRNRMARINADGSLHPFNPNFSSTSTEVRTIAVFGDTVFAGGAFDFVNGSARNNFVALNANTGANLGITANANGPLSGLAVLDGTLYMVGAFTQIGAATRFHCAAISAVAGNILGWNPNINGNLYGVAASPDGIYLAGSFLQVGSVPRQHLAKVDPITGIATAWDPFPSGYCEAISLSGNTLYVTGAFNTIGGEFRNRIAALDVNTGLATSWAPEYEGTVKSLIASGDQVFIGGDITSANGTPRFQIAAFDAATGAVTDFAPVADGGIVRALGVQDGHVYVGGEFASIGGVRRSNVAAVDLITGRATSWDPQANGEVYAIKRQGNTIYIGGTFDQLAGAPRTGLGAADPAGTLSSWAPQPNGDVRTLTIDGGVLYIGGEFTEMGGQTRGHVARFNMDDGTLAAWSPVADNTVHAIEPHGSVVYLGGDFTSMNGEARNRIAAVSLATGATTSWDPNASGSVYSISTTDDAVYAAGSFTGPIGGQSRNRAAKLDPTTGLSTPWNPSPNGTVYRIKAVGDSVLMGGSFSSVASAPRYGLGVTNTTTGAALPFKLDPAQLGLRDFAMSPGYFHLAGDFTYVNGPIGAGGTPRKYLATFVTNTISAVAVSGPYCPGFSYSIDYTVQGAFGADNVFTAELSTAGGSFTTSVPIGSVPATSSGTITATFPGNTLPGPLYRMRIRSSNPQQYGAHSDPFGFDTATTWYLDADNDGFGVLGTDSLSCTQPAGYAAAAFDCDDADDTIYPGAPCDDGDPNTTGETWLEDCTCGNGQYNGLDLVYDTIPGWWMTDGPVLAIEPDTANGRVFIGGHFDFMYPQIPWRPYGGQVDAGNAAPSEGVHPNGIVLQAVADGAGGWFICGEFTAVGGVARNHIARINADGTLNAWNVNVNGKVNSVLLSGGVLYFAGSFSQVSNTGRSNLAAVDASSGALLGWAPAANGQVGQLIMNGTTIYFRGAFSQVNGSQRSGLAAVSTTGTLQQWNPTVTGGVAGMATGGQAVFLGGSISSVNGTPRNKLAAVNLTTGGLYSWAPSPDGYFVSDIAAHNNRVYVAGSITGGVKAYEGSGAGNLIWSANTGFVDRIFAVGNSVVIAGFYEVGEGLIKNVAMRNGATGALLPWDPGVTGEVFTAALSNNSSKIYLGGDFQVLGATRRKNLACVEMGTGIPNTWNPLANGDVYALALSGNKLYVGGQFTQVGGVARNNLASVDANTGSTLPFNPGPNSNVMALATGGGSVYAGGHFITLAGENRYRLAAFDSTTGALTAWNPSPDAKVGALAYDSGLVYVGGDFSTIGTEPRNYAAVIDAQTGLPTPWNAGYAASAPHVNTILLKGSRVYIGTTNSLRLHEKGTGASLPLSPTPNGGVNGLASDGRTVFLGGAFTNLNPEGGPRLRLASFDTDYEQYGPFNPGMNATINAVASGGGMLFTGGDFTTVGGATRTHFAAFGLLDCNNVAGGGAFEGAPCDDGDPATVDDVWGADCTCAGDLITTLAVLPLENGLKGYPSPVRDVLLLSQTVDATIHDVHGRQLAVVAHANFVQVSGLATGIYFLRTSNGHVLRFVKE